SVMSGIGYGDAKIQSVNDPQLGKHVVQISTKTLQPAKVDQVRQQLDARFGVRAADFTSESIGPTFGAQIARTAGIALIASPVLTEWKEREPLYRRRRQLVREDHDGVVPAYASTQLGEEEEALEPGTRRRTGRRVIADRPGRPARDSRPAAPQRMAGPLAPEIEAPEAEAPPEVAAPDEINPDGDAELAEDSADATNGAFVDG